MKRFLVVGGDAAGMTAASHVKRALPSAEVVVFEQGPFTSFSACGIPYLVAGEVEEHERLVARTPEKHRANGLDVQLRTRATRVDVERRTVVVTDLVTGTPRTEPYDALLLATGARPRVPPIPGVEEFGMPLQTLEEGVHLRDRLVARGVRHVVVLGTGYIGLEIAEALVQRGIEATLVDRAEQVMSTLDPDMAAHVQAAMEGFGITVLLGRELKSVERDGNRCTGVVTDEGSLEADVVVVATGTRPNVELAEGAGIVIGASGAVAVDGRMRTSGPSVWAAGDCAESTHLLTGRAVNIQLGTHANKQGKVAGLDIAAVLAGEGHGAAVFPGVVGTAVTKLCRWEVGRTGLTEREAREAGIGYRAVTFKGTARSAYMPDPGTVHVKVLAEEGTGRVLGAQLVGTGNVAKRIDVAATWCHLGVTVQEAQFFDLSYAPPFGGTWDLLQVAARKLVAELGLQPQL